MTVLEAIAAEIEPYSLSTDSYEKAFVDANSRLNEVDEDFAPEEERYSAALKKTVAYASILCLNRLRNLSSENLGGISQGYDSSRIEKRMKAIAAENNLPIEDLLTDEQIPTIEYVSVM